MRLWPKADKAELPQRIAKKRVRKVAVADAPHTWERRGKLWVCSGCLKRCNTRHACKKSNGHNCPGFSGKLAAIIAQPNGHTFAASEAANGQPLIACITCGGWASCEPVSLKEPCAGPPDRQTAGIAALICIAKGKHPIGGKGCLRVPLIAVRADHQREVEEAIARHLAAPKKKPTMVPVQRANSAAEQLFTCGSPGTTTTAQSAGQTKLQALQERVRAKSCGTMGNTVFN